MHRFATIKPQGVGRILPTVDALQFEYFGGRPMIYSSTLHLERSFWPRLHDFMETRSDDATRQH